MIKSEMIKIWNMSGCADHGPRHQKNTFTTDSKIMPPGGSNFGQNNCTFKMFMIDQDMKKKCNDI